MTAVSVDNPYTARITSGPRRGADGYDIVEMVAGPDEQIAATLHVRHWDGMITWSDHWELVPDLEPLGIVRSVNRGPATYGHVDCYFV